MKRYNLVLIIFLITLYSCKSQIKNVTNKKIETYLINLEQRGFSGSVLVAKEGKIILSKGYGFSDRENQTKNDSKTVFDIGSVTKQFTAAGILKLEMLGELSVNDKISMYFENLPEDKKSITIHHLLTHSSGLIPAIGDDYEAISTYDFLKKAFNQKLLFPIGSSYEYSNVGYSILGIIIEKVSKKTYENFLYEKLWKPANMEQTGYTRPNFKNKQAIGYKGGKSYGKPTEQKWDNNAPFWHLKANGGVLSSIDDMYKWHLTLLKNDILSKSAKEKYFTPYVKEGEDAPSHYGYGWAIYNTSRNTKLAAHNGGNGIFFADFWRYLDDNTVIILLNNNSTPYSQIIASQIGAITFLSNYEPQYPSESRQEIDKNQVTVLAKKAVLALSNNDKKEWKSFILNYGMKNFITMSPMETHLKYFSKFYSELKDGEIQAINLDDDKLTIDVKVEDKIIKLNMFIELNRDGELKFAGMRTE